MQRDRLANLRVGFCSSALSRFFPILTYDDEQAQQANSNANANTNQYSYVLLRLGIEHEKLMGGLPL